MDTITIIDGFLQPQEIDWLEDYARKLDYTGAENPDDGVVYPDISVEIPKWLRTQVEQRLAADIATDFFRLTCSTTQGAPHQAHTDSVMGEWTLLLYLSDGDKDAGTSLVRHIETGMESDPELASEIEAWKRDTNIPEAWEITQLINMRRNRAVFFPSRLMHRAEPVGGFGGCRKDGRIVYTAFLNDPAS